MTCALRWVSCVIIVACAARTAAAADVASAAATSQPRFITSGSGFVDYWPVFSPDGKNVLFSRSSDGGRTWDLWIVSADGGEPAHRFARAPVSVSATRANWSSKRPLIAFTGQSGAKASVWIISADGTDPHELPSTELYGAFYPSWYPDGAHIAVMDGAQLNIKLIDLARDHAETLTDRNRFLTGMPAVSPDGKSIAFAGQPNAGQPYDQTKNTLWLLELSSGEIHSLEATHGQGRAPSW